MWYDGAPMAESGDLLERAEQAAGAAEAEWAGCRLPPGVFTERLLAAVRAEGGDPILVLEKLHVADLYLAHACALRVPGALEAFAAKHLSRVDEYVRRFRGAAIQGADVRRDLEDALLLGKKGSEPRIGQYTGRGPLSRFVATAARNAALTLLRRRAQEPMLDVDAVASQLVFPPDSTRRLVDSRLDSALRAAVSASLSSLDRRQRTIVRLHLSESVPLTQIARMLKVHQSTVSRALDAAIAHLYAGIRRELREVHGLDDAEMESIVRDVRSQVELSLSRILRDTGVGS